VRTRRGWKVKCRRVEAAGGGGSCRPTSRERTAASRNVSDRFAAARSYLNGNKPICKRGNAEFVMLASHVNDSKDLRVRAAEMRASSKKLKDNNTAAVILRLADLYDRLADRAEIRGNGGVS
jgi:hypothetical protein